MTSAQMLKFEAGDFSFRASLLPDDNPEMVQQVLSTLPFDSTLGHVVISGEAIWMPTRIVHLGKSNMVKRSPGAVYFNAPGQSICFTYGSITESALVNKFGQVLEEDMAALRALGEFVWNKTVAQPRRELVKISVRRVS